MRLGVMMVAAAVLLGLAPTAQASIDLANPQHSIRIDGEPALTGESVAGAGDVNGDGVPDVIVGAPFDDANGRRDSGSAFVVYGGKGPGPIDLHNLGARGFRIDGSGFGDGAGFAVSGVGDFNGDGIADVAVGAPNTFFTAGSVYVVYGQATSDPSDVDLASLGARGFQFDGLTGNFGGNGDSVGTSVAPAGDVNDDGIVDFVVGAQGLDRATGIANSGAAYVIYGQRTADPADFRSVSLGSRGMAITGVGAQDRAGTAVGGGDVNGDGVGDVIVGAPGADNNGRADSGSAYVVFGQRLTDPADVDLGNPGGRGFRIDGQTAGDAAGEALAAGDVNGDGAADAIVGARLADNNERANSGSTYVVYGPRPRNPANVDLQALGSSGFRIDGAAAGDEAGLAVGFGGDLSGDGIGDVVVGAPDATAGGRVNSGQVFVVDGQRGAGPADVDLASLGDGGLELDGPAGELAGAGLGAVGDENGDGHPELIVGATGVDATYVVDATGPDTTIDSAPPAPTNTTPTFSFHTSEANTTFQCSIDQGAPSFAPCSGPDASDMPATPLADGTYTFRVAAVDSSLNPDATPATQAFTVDTTPPETSVDSGATVTNDATPTFAFSSPDAGASFQCSIDQGTPSFSSCSGPGATHTPMSPLSDGGHTFRVQAIDQAGNGDPSPATRTVTVDTLPPQTRITKAPPTIVRLKGTKKAAAVRFSFRASEQVSGLVCALDGHKPKPCASPKAYELKKGRHHFSVTATDLAGNVDPSAAKVRVTVKPARRAPRS
jgi:hypothetical protein